MSEKLDYLLAALDYHLAASDEPVEAWRKALEDYAFVWHTDDERTLLQLASERVLYHIGKREEQE